MGQNHKSNRHAGKTHCSHCGQRTETNSNGICKACGRPKAK